MGKMALYYKNKEAKCGEIIVCPICGREFKKKQYSQAFCCGTCKDKYHNSFGDRHKKGYYDRYNEKHPERLERLRSRFDDEDDDDIFDDDSWMFCDNPQLGI